LSELLGDPFLFTSDWVKGHGVNRGESEQMIISISMPLSELVKRLNSSMVGIESYVQRAEGERKTNSKTAMPKTKLNDL
jgi:hypothetical protein